MSQTTKTITVNGFVNLGTALSSGGYKGTTRLDEIYIFNPSATVVYLHMNASGQVPPTTGTDGIPISSSGTTSPLHLQGSDAGLIWLYSAASVDVKILATGDGV